MFSYLSAIKVNFIVSKFCLCLSYACDCCLPFPFTIYIPELTVYGIIQLWHDNRNACAVYYFSILYYCTVVYFVHLFIGFAGTDISIVSSVPCQGQTNKSQVDESLVLTNMTVPYQSFANEGKRKDSQNSGMLL